MRWCSWLPTRPALSPVLACRSTAAWVCDPQSRYREEKFMSSTKPVVVYGASGYTGRLVCEYLRELCIPFIAAGRDKARIQEALDLIPGIKAVDHEIIEVDHEVGPLSDLFARAKVVC